LYSPKGPGAEAVALPQPSGAAVLVLRSRAEVANLRLGKATSHPANRRPKSSKDRHSSRRPRSVDRTSSAKVSSLPGRANRDRINHARPKNRQANGSRARISSVKPNSLQVRSSSRISARRSSPQAVSSRVKHNKVARNNRAAPRP